MPNSAKNWSFFILRHTGQAIAAVVLILSIIWVLGSPALTQFIKSTMALKMVEYESKQNKLIDNTNELTRQQGVILEKIKSGEVIQKYLREDQKEQGRDIKEILRIMRTR